MGDLDYFTWLTSTDWPLLWARVLFAGVLAGSVLGALRAIVRFWDL